MNWFKNLKVRSELLCAFMLVLVIAVGVSTFLLVQYIDSDLSYTDAIDDVYE